MEDQGVAVSKVSGKKVVRRSKRRKTVTNSPASLPPQVPDVDAAALVVPQPSKKADSGVPGWKLDKSSKQYEQAQKVLALKAVGMIAADIAESMGISKQTVHNLTYLAGKNGWMTEFANAREQIEFRIMPKALRVIEDGLSDKVRHTTSGQTVAQQIALEVAGGTIFKDFESAAGSQQVPVNNIIGIRIETTPGAVSVMREGSGGDTPAYIDGEVGNVGLGDERS
jgi:hypothetical protein